MIMKKIMPFFLFFQSLLVYPQFQDNFNDGRFYNQSGYERDVNWKGDISEFTVNDICQLQLSSDAGKSPAQLSTSCSLTKNSNWSFFVKMDFTPTASNYVKMYLMSDEENLKEDLNGIFVRIGYTDKNICLMQSQRGKNNKTLIKGNPKRLDVPIVKLNIKVTLDNNGNFNLYSKTENDEEFILEGSCRLEEFPSSKWFGIVCIFTTTRSQSFYFDDLIIEKVEDEENPIIPPDPEEDYPGYGDILFSEIMANPQTGNPEYIELYNQSDSLIHLKNCLFYYGDKSFSLPDKIIPAKTYFLLGKNSIKESLPENVLICGVSNFPTLANSGKLLMIKTVTDELISWFEYSDAMYEDTEKKKGGWSLECKDLTNSSNLSDNWSACVDELGGTPGKSNSIQCNYPDNHPVQIKSILTIDKETFEISFSKPMNPKSLVDKDFYHLDNSEYTITGVNTNYPQCTLLSVKLNQPSRDGDWIELVIPELTDLSGKKPESGYSILLGNAFDTKANEVLINEILFNPEDGCNEYVEIVNNSDKELDLRFLSITSRKPSDGSFNKVYPLSLLPYTFSTNGYLVISKSKDILCDFFSCNEKALFSELGNMPSLANTGGCVVIFNNLTGEIIDEFYYSQSMHSSAVKDKKGVALERISLAKPTNDADNWTSASGTNGYGTPGHINSCQSDLIPVERNKNSFTLEYPGLDNNSYRLVYQLDKPGYTCRITLFDITGRIVNYLINNEILGIQGVIPWNEYQQLDAGIYIVYAEIFDTTGNIYKFKIPAIIK